MSSFDGQVTFHCIRPNLKVEIIRDLLRSAVPESAKFPLGGDAERIFENLGMLLGRTTGIEFALSEPENPDLVALREFWAVASTREIDYRGIWDRFILLNTEVHNVWVREVNDTLNVFAAPPELQPGAPDDEHLDPNV